MYVKDVMNYIRVCAKKTGFSLKYENIKFSVRYWRKKAEKFFKIKIVSNLERLYARRVELLGIRLFFL